MLPHRSAGAWQQRGHLHCRQGSERGGERPAGCRALQRGRARSGVECTRGSAANQPARRRHQLRPGVTEPKVRSLEPGSTSSQAATDRSRRKRPAKVSQSVGSPEISAYRLGPRRACVRARSHVCTYTHKRSGRSESLRDAFLCFFFLCWQPPSEPPPPLLVGGSPSAQIISRATQIVRAHFASSLEPVFPETTVRFPPQQPAPWPLVSEGGLPLLLCMRSSSAAPCSSSAWCVVALPSSHFLARTCLPDLAATVDAVYI